MKPAVKDTLPPRSLEQLLRLLLPTRDRDTISGDLCEEYRECRLPQQGRTRANLWYVQQIVSFVPRSLLLHTLERRVLTLLCCFTGMAGSWLGFMDVYLKHGNLAAHETIAGIILGQALLTLLALRFHRQGPLRFLAVAGCVAILWLACKAFVGLMTASDFEGYIALIALGLVFQAVLTVLTLARKPFATQASL